MGSFALTSAFGRKANPGTQVPYTQIDRNDAWTYNPKIPSTYNMFQSVNRSWASYGKYVEHLWQLGPQYDYVLTTTFNQPVGEIARGSDGINRAIPSADTRRGGGIFFHVSKGLPTAGCISMKRNVMRSLLKWLKPESHPIAVIGLTKNLSV
jgi:L,D-peptidoglycan transpeptidase YkuD (ErfK/YbiS/YcfS/YnhG family)